MFYRNTKWAERYAAGQANQVMPGLNRTGRRWDTVLRYGRDDFETGSEYFWFYMHYLVITIGTLLTLALIILIIAIYAHPPTGRHPDWRFLLLSVLPSVAIFVWICTDGSAETCMKPWPKTRLAIEAIVLGGSIACTCLFGAFFAKVSKEDYFVHCYATMLAFLAVLSFTRIIRMIEMILIVLVRPRAERSTANEPAQV
ncbi:hypothetical protein M406DRAFT_357241 [Cryphonectria parasitica EP155]|uniref:Uncharacterized protein n=1 Tax=Cryphonectria parasitica (strain ATCC 38755 / EP155) TaxID=660469 RepID=A0A9P5CN68_CRYP1|nr:uncharacterized protein M406DRAFT_357241 [Cryphonectria parasitica EP155]KAF3763821.1 hypothetical protein M406DRAFT_357241 [Cryphonectria parasitica EP155]